MRYPNGCHAAGANNFKIILTANGCSVVPQPREHGVWWLVLVLGAGIMVLSRSAPDVGPWLLPTLHPPLRQLGMVVLVVPILVDAPSGGPK